MRRSAKLAATATLAALLVSGGATVANATQLASDDASVETYSVPADEMATSTSWSSERMEAAIPGDVLVIDDISAIDLDRSDVVIGQPTTVHGQSPSVDLMATQESPISHIGKVFFTLGGKDYVCSANSVASENGNTVSTAGHCLNEGPGEFATEFIFVPAYDNGDAPYGQWAATEMFAPTEWVEEGDMNYDTAFAVVESPTGETLSDTVGASGVAFNQATRQFYTAYGYPAGAPFDGQTLQSCASTSILNVVGDSTAQGIRCDMTGGSSGGPWFLGSGSEGIQNSVNSFKYGFLPEAMFGPYWGDVIESAYDEAQSA